MTSFEYPRHNLSIRVSTDMDDLLEDAARDLGTSKTSVVVYLIAQFIDPTGKACPDIGHLPENLACDFKPVQFRRRYGRLEDVPGEEMEIDENGEVYTLDKRGKRVYN